jgi:hypothetical protein
MKYERPEMFLVAAAVTAILGGKGTSELPDNLIEQTYTVPAYQADE